MDSMLSVNAPAVVAEVIDGEAVIMDLASGHYFSTQGVGCDIWRAIEGGASRSDIVRSLVATYDVEPQVAGSAVTAFVEELAQRNLVIESNGEHSRAALIGAPGTGSRLPFATPVLNSYTDMEELLLLDPIHDVDETGWPMPKAPDTPETPSA